MGKIVDVRGYALAQDVLQGIMKTQIAFLLMEHTAEEIVAKAESLGYKDVFYVKEVKDDQVQS